MGLLDFLKPSSSPPTVVAQEPWDFNVTAALAKDSKIAIFENKSLTILGEPTGYDFATILQDPQSNMDSLYRLSAYYKESDAMFGGAIRNVYIPFSVAKGFRLTGASEATKKKYLDHYDMIGFRDRMVSIMEQLHTFNNVFIYLMPDGNMISLMPTRCRIDEVFANGEPIVSYDTQDIMQILNTTGSKTETFIKTHEARLKGLPPEVASELGKSNAARWVQLDPENIFVLQTPKPDWVKYAIPRVAPCLNALSRKALIENYEKAQLQFGIKGFLHVKVGDKDPTSGVSKPTNERLKQLYSSFESALSGGVQVITPWYVDSKFVTVDTKTLFEQDKYAGVNAEILSACGISGIVVGGQQESGSFGEAKISLETVALKIKEAQNNFAEMMNKINFVLANRIPRISTKNIPKFEFNEVDLANDGKFSDAVFKLWSQGLASNQTLLESYGLDITQEIERKKSEASQNQSSIFIPPKNAYTSNTGDQTQQPQQDKNNPADDNTGGRPTKSLSERNSDPANSDTGAQPKPSNPDGSQA